MPFTKYNYEVKEVMGRAYSRKGDVEEEDDEKKNKKKASRIMLRMPEGKKPLGRP
jgi:hypothetical protein